MPSSPPLELLVPGALAAGFVIGKIALSGGAGTAEGDASSAAAAGAKAVASGHADTTAQEDLYGAFGDSATIDFGASGAAGVLNGVRPYANPDDPSASGYDPYASGGYDPYASGGLPGGGDAVLPPPPAPSSTPVPNPDPATAPPPAPTPTPTPAPTTTAAPFPGTTPRPAGAGGWFSVSGGTFFHYTVSGGKITARVSVSGRRFTAWCTAPKAYVWAGHGTYSLVKVLTGAYAGWYIGVTNVAYHPG